MKARTFDKLGRMRAPQRGAVLVVGMIFLVLLTLLGITAFNVATQEERMSGNTRDRGRAFEAAERALRDCEEYLGSVLPPKFSDNGSLDPGMYNTPIPPTGNLSVLPDDIWMVINWDTALQTTSSGSARSTTVPGTAGPAKCIVEKVASVRRQNPSRRAELPIQTDTAYMVSARGLGANPASQVFLQSYYIRN